MNWRSDLCTGVWIVRAHDSRLCRFFIRLTGASEEDLDRAEELLGWPLPTDLRLLYRFHNGQVTATVIVICKLTVAVILEVTVTVTFALTVLSTATALASVTVTAIPVLVTVPVISVTVIR